MERCYLKLDEQLDQLIGVEWSSPASRREAMHERLTKGWVYHELAVEGFGIDAASLERALKGEVGGAHLERTAFERARRFRAAYQRMREVGASAEPLNRGQALAYLGWLTGRVEAGAMRKEAGATEQFKHEVVAPEQIDKALGMMFAEADLMSSRLHPIDLAVQVHHRFVKIWPFEKHSAAVARLLANQVLLANGYPAVIIPSYERQRYYHALHYDVSRSRELFVEGLAEQAQIRFRELSPRRESVAA
jgi:Fic family protein